MTIRQYLESCAKSYHNLASEFDNYSPKNELYNGYSRMCDQLLHDLSDETLESPAVLRQFHYCNECKYYNSFHHVCRDDQGDEIRILVFDNTEACEFFKPSNSTGGTEDE